MSNTANRRRVSPYSPAVEEWEFLRLVYDPAYRPRLLSHLQKLGLLESFLEAESEEKEAKP